MFLVGQGILGKVRFPDGCTPMYDRTYLVVDVRSNSVGLINVSSTAGKEHKLLFPDNLELINENPPFLKKSFVKLDSLVYIDFSEASKMFVLHRGAVLNSTDMKAVLSGLKLIK